MRVCERDAQSFQTSGIFKYHATPPTERSRPVTLSEIWKFLEPLHSHWQFLSCVILKMKMTEPSTEMGLLRLRKARSCPEESERCPTSSVKPDKRSQMALPEHVYLSSAESLVPTPSPPWSLTHNLHSINSSEKLAGRFRSILGLKD